LTNDDGDDDDDDDNERHMMIAEAPAYKMFTVLDCLDTEIMGWNPIGGICSRF
jgi:hypothetical protein